MSAGPGARATFEFPTTTADLPPARISRIRTRRAAIHADQARRHVPRLCGRPPALGAGAHASSTLTQPPRCYHRRTMTGDDQLRRLRALAADQFGLFTAAQARKVHVDSSGLGRLIASDALFRVRDLEVYGFTDDAADKFLYEDWAAQWLALQPDADVEVRRNDPDCVISHDSAAVILELGTLVSHGLHLTSPQPISPRSPNVFTHQSPIGARGVDWDVVEGLPVSTAGRIIEDLARDDLDGSHQGTVIADAVGSGLISVAAAGVRLAPFAHQYRARDGLELAHRFADAAGRRLPG